MPGWEPLREMVALEFTQAREEGKDPRAIDALRPQFEAAANDTVAHDTAAGDAARLRAVYEALLNLPVEADFGFDEPNELEAIRQLRPAVQTRRFDVDLQSAAFADKMRGAWLARCAGCALGKPVEQFMEPQHGLKSWERQKVYLSAIAPDEWPLRDYFSGHSPAQNRAGTVTCPDSTRERIAFMETDDDIRYTVLGQMILNQYGREFSTFDVARTWMEQLPYALVCTAETQAYRNLVERYDFHMALWRNAPRPDVDWNWVAHHENPYREWIGAQIRVDSYGYGAPGQPELAAEWAWRDARLSHVKNGIYGAMFCAALIAAAFALDDMDAVLEAGLAEIPATSRLYNEMRRVISICDKYGRDFGQFEAVLAEIYALLGHYNPVHTNNNCGLIVAALLLGNGDFERALTLAVMGGWDTDCNGATVGSVIGAMLGAQALPQFWVGRLNDTLRSRVADYHPIAISECARRSVEIARKCA